MNIETIEAVGKVVVAVVTAITTPTFAFFTWKTRYELDKLYAATYRPNEDGSPGPMRKHPGLMVRLFQRKKRLE